MYRGLILNGRFTDSTDDWNAKRQDVILHAAILFAERGADSVSMRDIAAAANLHVSTLYYYFPGKADLYRAATQWAFERMSKAATRALSQKGTTRQRIRRLTEATVSFLVEDRIAARLLDYDFVFGVSLWDKGEYPQLTKEPTKLLADLLVEMHSPLLMRLGAMRLAEISWDVIYGIVRFSRAHARVAEGECSQIDQETLASQAWMILERVLFESEETKPRRRP